MNEPTEDIKKYAYAEVITGDETERWFLDLESKAGHIAQPSSVGVRKESRAETDTAYSAQKWVEPRLRFADLLAWLDLNIWHKRCIIAKATAIGGLGWRLVTDDEDKTPDDAYERIMVFLDQPNEDPLMTFDEILYRSLIDLESLGNMVNEVSRTLGQGNGCHLYHQRMVNFRRDKNARSGGYYQVPQKNYSTRSIAFSRFGHPYPDMNEILHFYDYDPTSDYYGMPDWVAALADMLLDRSAVEFNINLFRNQLVAKFAVIVEGGKLSPQAKQSLRDFLASQATGTKNAGRTLIFDTDDKDVKVKIEKLEMDFGDKNNFMGTTRTTARDMIISAHGVPPRLVGVVVAGQLGGGGEGDSQLRIFEELNCAPKRKRLVQTYNRSVLRLFGDHKWKLELLGIDTTDKNVDSEIAERLSNSGLILPEEAREDLGYPALDEEGMARLAASGTTQQLAQETNALVSLRKRLEALGD